MLRRASLFVLVAAAVALPLAAVIMADDFEDPVEPPAFLSVSASYGETEVDAEDVWGPSIDVKDALEPQMTVMLMTEDATTSPGMVTVVQTSPTFETWVAGP